MLWQEGESIPKDLPNLDQMDLGRGMCSRERTSNSSTHSSCVPGLCCPDNPRGSALYIPVLNGKGEFKNKNENNFETSNFKVKNQNISIFSDFFHVLI